MVNAVVGSSKMISRPPLWSARRIFSLRRSTAESRPACSRGSRPVRRDNRPQASACRARRPMAAARPAAQHRILRDRERIDDRRFLRHQEDALAFHRLDVDSAERLAVEQNIAFGRAVHARDDLHQRRFARAVLAQEAMHGSGVDPERHALKRGHSAKAFDHMSSFKQRRAIQRRFPFRCGPPGGEPAVDFSAFLVLQAPIVVGYVTPHPLVVRGGDARSRRAG